MENVEFSPELDRLRTASVKLIQGDERYMELVMHWMDACGSIIRPMLRGKATAEETKMIILIKELINSTATREEVTLYRGLNGVFATHLLASAQAGYSFDRASVQSFTYGKDIALGFTDEEAGCCLLEITIPIGTPIFYISSWEAINEGDAARSEQEFIVPPGRIVFTEVHREEESTVITGTFLATEWPPLLLK